LGILFGIGVALFFIFSANEKSITDKKIITAPNITITPANFKSASFDITSPTNNLVTDKSSVTIKGNAAKNALLIFSSPTTDRSLKTTSETFQINFPISAGENIIKITSYSDQNTEERTLKVYVLE